MKKCNKCLVLKDISEFNKHKSTIDGFRNTCKSCVKIYLSKNKERIKKLAHINYLNNKDKVLKRGKEYRDTHKKELDEYLLKNKLHRKIIHQEYREKNKSKLSDQKKKYYGLNKEKIKQYRIKNKININNNKKIRMKNDPVFRLSTNLRNCISYYFKNKEHIKKSKTEEILGCSFKYFKSHIESKFEIWMNWENYGLFNGELDYGWDIDHIIPASSAKTEEDVVRLNHYTNLQPMCSYINRVLKKDKVEYEQ